MENTSGHGKSTIVPKELKRWSWGAFLLSWIWSIGNRVWIGLFALVPYVGLIVAIILGVKGRELAWKSKRWDSIEHFNNVQKRWAQWGVGLIVIPAVLGIVAAIAVPLYTARTGEPQMVTALSGGSQITVPQGWRVMDELHDDADIKVANVRANSYFIVISESKQSLNNMSLKEYSRITLQGLMENNVHPQISGGPKESTINGRPSIQYEITGSVDNVDLVYLHTSVNGENDYHQLLSWTSLSSMEKNRARMESIINSFSEKGM